MAIEKFAHSNRYKVIETYYDEAVSGADAIDMRPGFKRMLDRLLGNGIRTILVETASRFARDLIVQETGHAMLKEYGIEIVAADSPDAFLDDTPTATLIRQILGAVSQFEKAMVVSKLRAARDRKRATGVKVEGRKGYAEVKPELIALAKKLHRYPVRGRLRSLREVSRELAKAGHVTLNGTPFTATAIARMLET